MQQSPAQFSRPGGDRRACLLVFPVPKAGTVFWPPTEQSSGDGRKAEDRGTCLMPGTVELQAEARSNGQLNAYDMLG